MYVASFSPKSAIGTIHHASTSGFQLSGRFNALTDNAILEWNRDNDFEHPQLRYLPDGDFSGLTLTYDFAHSGLADIASPIFPYADYPYLNIYAGANESLYQIPLKNYATVASGSANLPASATITLGGTMTNSDAVGVLFFGEAYWHTIASSNPADAISDLVVQINTNSPTMTAAAGPSAGDLKLTTIRLGDDANLIRGYTLVVGRATQATGTANFSGTPSAGDQASITIAPRVGAPFTTTYTAASGDSIGTVAQTLAAAINADPGNPSSGAAAFWSGTMITLAAKELGAAGNAVTFSCAGTGGISITPGAATHLAGGVDHATPTESWTPTKFHCTGGHSPTWHIVLPFDLLADTLTRGVPASQIRKMQWTFSPPLPDSAPFAFQEWTATFSSWSLTGSGRTLLKRAAPGLRFEDASPDVRRSGSWSRVPGQYSGGGYSASGAGGDYLELTYHFAYTHDLYLGVFKDEFSGIALLTVDGVALANQDLYGGPYNNYRARVEVAAGLGAGLHTVRLTVSGAKNVASSGWNCNVDFFEAAAPGDWNDPPVIASDVGFATDFDTAHTLGLSPQRTLWGIRSLGIRGEVNHFVGIGQFAERSRQGGFFPQRVYTFSGSATPNDQIFLNFDSASVGHFVQIGDTLDTIVEALAFEINEQFDAVVADYSGSVLTVTVRDPSFSLATTEQVLGAHTEIISAVGNLTGGVIGTWEADPSFLPVLNLATRDWHADFASTTAAAGMSVIYTYSTELTDAPLLFAQLYPDGSPVITANPSVQTTFRPETLTYWQEVYLETAQLMVSAGVTPALQFGEVQWWYTPSGGGMAYYDSYTTAQFLALHGRPLHLFTAPNDDPSLWPVDAAFLRDQLDAHTAAIMSCVRAAFPTVRFEVLWPRDVNDPATRRLNYVVNLPAGWSAADFDSFKCEAFGYTSPDHDMSEANAAIRFPIDVQGFTAANSRHIVGLFGYPWPWARVLVLARRAGLGGISLWAYDQFCLFALPAPLPVEERRAQFVR